MSTFSDYNIERLSQSCNGVIFEIEFHICSFHWFFWKWKRDITGNDVDVYVSFGGAYGHGYCSSTDSCNVCTITEFILVVTFCENILMFFFIRLSWKILNQDSPHAVLFAALSSAARHISRFIGTRENKTISAI